MAWHLNQKDFLEVIAKIRTGERQFELTSEYSDLPIPFFIADLGSDRQIVFAAKNPTDILLGDYEPGMYLHGGKILVLDVSYNDLEPDCIKMLETEGVYLVSHRMKALEDHLLQDVVHPFVDALDEEECRKIGRIRYGNGIRMTAKKKLLGGNPHMDSPYELPSRYGLTEDEVIRDFFEIEDLDAETLRALEKDRHDRMEMKGFILCVDDAMKDPALVEDWEKRLAEAMRESMSRNRQYVSATFHKDETGSEMTVKVTPDSVLNCLIGSEIGSSRYGFSASRDAQGLPRWYFDKIDVSPWDAPPVSAIRIIMYGRSVLYEK